MIKHNPIVLYFPYLSVGGVSVLFLRIAKLYRESHRVILMDLENGYMAQNLPEGVELLTYDQKEKVPEDAVIIFQGVYPWRIRNFNKFPKTAKVLFWHLHPDNFYPFYFDKFRKIQVLKFITFAASALKLNVGRKLLSFLVQNDSLVFMDETNRKSSFEYFGLGNKNSKILKIFTDESSSIKYIPRKIDNVQKTVNLGWIGRLEDFKTSILMHTLNRLQSIEKIKFNFTIIGNGSDSLQFYRFKSKCGQYKIRIIDEIAPSDIPNFLNKFDILFGMGTSALEGAKLGIPTILLDYSFHQIEKLYMFKPVFEHDGFSLGAKIHNSSFEDSCSLGDLLSKILSNYEEYSYKSYNYWKDNFSPEVFRTDFDRVLSQCTFSISNIIQNDFHKPDFFTRMLYYIRNKIKGDTNIEVWQY